MNAEELTAAAERVAGPMSCATDDSIAVAKAYLERIAADEAERELSAKCRAEWMRRLGQTDTEAPVGTLADECGQLMAMLAIERKADEAERAERFGKASDPHWLRSLKCGEWLDNFGTWYVEDEDGVSRLVEYCDGPEFWFVLGERIWRDSEPCKGQLLDLLAALGVKPKETT